ncbi:SDR family NAD(P)-dependent oxidoreductase [Salipiger abyssi]|uniref:SDR family NAD(P)-dependent oxidoreductase n=1 Tax=Salipiger abyssi TaxID=1250539 RepID=UPI00405987DA
MTRRPVTIVTGAAEGIGWATARLFAARGHAVVIADIQADKARARAGELGPEHLGLAADIRDEAQVAALFETLDTRYGRCDGLINNAGVGDSPVPTVEQTAEHFRRVLDINLTGAFVMSQAAARRMQRDGRGGAIVNFSSIAGLAGLPLRNAYGAAKAGLIALTRNLACEWAGAGIRVNAVAPGYVDTPLVRDLAARGLFDLAAVKARCPMGRLITPEEIAEAVWFLASPAASAITGTTLAVDAGWTAYGAAGAASGA